MKKIKIGLLPRVLIAIALGIVCALFFPHGLVRVFLTFNSVFSNFLGLIIPLLILGLVAPGIFELGKGAGRLLLMTAVLAYASTVLSGYFSYFTCRAVFPRMLTPGTLAAVDMAGGLTPYFTIAMPPFMDVTTALVLAFVIGLGLNAVPGTAFRQLMIDLRDLIHLVITKVIVPLLPLYIFGIFLQMGAEGKVGSVMGLFGEVILVIFVMHVLLLVGQYCIAGLIARRNPFKALWTMIPAYLTALGTASSAATIPVTLAQAKKNGVRPEVAEFTVPLCATIHLAGSMLKMVACAFVLSYVMGMPVDFRLFTGFIFMVGITCVAAPGVPGGAIMAALGVLTSILGFDESMLGLMIALYIAMDSFGTAANVTGDGAIALIINRIQAKNV